MIKRLIITPFQKFVSIESFSGVLLFVVTILAMLWANSPYGTVYESIWQYKMGVKFHNFELIKPLFLWINDGLMAIFFFLIGLELKRELLIGELDTVKKATFPFFAALGGILVPIAIFLLMNNKLETSHAWGIPMATDIAFALAILVILGKRIPLSLKVFLTAFAIIDDIGAVLVIAVFYSAAINWVLLLYAAILLLILGYLSYRNYYKKSLFLIVGIIVWLLFLKSGVHPTIAGVFLAFTIPIRQVINNKEYVTKMLGIVHRLKDNKNNETNLLSKEQINEIEVLESITEKVRSPLQDLEYKLHNWVAYFIIPVFVLANAGVIINTSIQMDQSLIFNIAIALLIGKSLGIFVFSFIGVQLKLIELPSGIIFKQIFGVAVLAGVGFTMSIFIANLAFSDSEIYVASAKIGIIIGSLISGIIGYTVLRITSTKITVNVINQNQNIKKQ